MKAFIELNNQTNWIDNKHELEDIFQDVYGFHKDVDDSFCLRICPDDDMDTEFLEKVKGYRFPGYKQLQIVNFDIYEEDGFNIVTNFMIMSKPKFLREFNIFGYPQAQNIQLLMKAFEVIFPLVTDKIEINEFEIDQYQLSHIFEL